MPDDPAMEAVAYRSGELYMGDVPVAELAARFGTPLYAYSARVLRERFLSLQAALQDLAPRVTICYALKANANLALASMLAGRGAGADIVSGGELYLALRAGFPAERIVFAGVGKTRAEMAEGLRAGVRAFHVESAGEMDALAEVAAAEGHVAPVAVRVNPDVDPHTHPYITTGKRENKFGVRPEQALDLVRRAARTPSLRPVGLHAHVGSQLLEVQPIIDAAAALLKLWDRLAGEGIALRDVDIGGGLGIAYRPEDRPQGPGALAAGLRPLLHGRDLDLVLEPGRFLVGPAGVLLTRVSYLKPVGEGDAGHYFAIVDAGMNDLLRPALYGAWHPVWPAREAAPDSAVERTLYDVVGPVCESSDVLARERHLGALAPGDLLAIGQAGAYGFAMSSQYNARPRPAEVLVDGDYARIIRRRETYEALLLNAE